MIFVTWGNSTSIVIFGWVVCPNILKCQFRLHPIHVHDIFANKYNLTLDKSCSLIYKYAGLGFKLINTIDLTRRNNQHENIVCVHNTDTMQNKVFGDKKTKKHNESVTTYNLCDQTTLKPVYFFQNNNTNLCNQIFLLRWDVYFASIATFCHIYHKIER